MLKRIEGEGEGEKHGHEGETWISFLICTLSRNGTCTWTRALSGNQTSDLLLCRIMPKKLSHTCHCSGNLFKLPCYCSPSMIFKLKVGFLDNCQINFLGKCQARTPWSYLAFQGQHGRLQISLPSFRDLPAEDLIPGHTWVDTVSSWSRPIKKIPAVVLFFFFLSFEIQINYGFSSDRTNLSPFFFFNIFYWLCYYSCPISPHLFPSTLHMLCPLHFSTPLVQVHGLYI